MDKLIPSLPTPLQPLSNALTRDAGIKLFIKRDDLIHPAVSGNKWRKLKYNLARAKSEHARCLLTFGGAYSSHLYATAAAGHALGLKTIGIVRGEEGALHPTSTLRFCSSRQMQLHFVSRQVYRQHNDPAYLAELSERFGRPYIIPEGGTTAEALPGMQEMTDEVYHTLGMHPDYYCTAVGTGGTAAGILSAGRSVIGFSALKGGDFLQDDIMALLSGKQGIGQLDLRTEYHFGGYGKCMPELLDFIVNFKQEFGIQLEQVYTGKMFYGLFELIRQHYFERGTCVVALHTGGLQGLTEAARG